MNIAVVEDCEKDRTTLIAYIQKFFLAQNMEYQAFEYPLAEYFLEEDNLSLMDVVFLDIFIGEKNGVEIARQLRKSGYQGMIVFCTVTPEFALAGYDVKAFGYILKPYTFERIQELLTDILETIHKEIPSICIKESRCWYKIPLHDILYIENRANYVSVCTNSRVFSTRMAFKEMDNLLGSNHHFIRCNRGTIINLSYVWKIDGPCVTLRSPKGQDVCELPISRRYIPSVNEQYVNYIFEELDI